MQIIPTQNKTPGILPFEFLSSQSPFAGNTADLFSRMLKGATSSYQGSSVQEYVSPGRPVGDYPDASSEAAVKTADILLSIPGAPMRRDDPAHDVKLTSQDFTEARPTLEKAGMSEKKIEELEHKTQSPEGLTWGQLAHAVKETVVERASGGGRLSEGEKTEVTSFLTRAGFSPEEAAKLTQALQGPHASKALDAISAKLKELDPSATLSISQDEMSALAKALKLPQSATQRLLGAFGGGQNLELGRDGMLQAVAALKDEHSTAMAQIKDVLHGVSNELDPLKQKALARLDAAKDAADARVSSDSVKTSNMLAEPKQAGDKHGNQGQPQNQTPGQDAGTGDAARKGAAAQQQAAGKNAAQDAKAGNDRAGAEFAAKVRTEGGVSQPGADARLAGAQTISQQVSALGREGAGQGQAGRLQSASVLDQVESGILRNLGQGVKQLSLELTPEALGKLNLVLTVKGKEVQALIKADTPQAEKLIAENLPQIKQSLENQGLTVSKLEVRSGLSQDPNMGQHWAGADKHNLSQERREALGRMRTHSMISGDGDASMLARGVQNNGAEVKNSQGGLSLFA